MPRVALKRKEYMVADLSKWIVGKMYEKRISQKEMADMLGITQQAFGQRLRRGYFPYKDLIQIIKKLDATDEEILRLMRI